MQNERQDFQASRAVILRRAIEVIEEKQQQRAELQANCDRLRSETAELEREIRMIKENLAKPHEAPLFEHNRPNLIYPKSPQPTSVSAVMKTEHGNVCFVRWKYTVKQNELDGNRNSHLRRRRDIRLSTK
ncbi:hypothetical protein OSTOST_18770 [Ostertagia ostertagi]